MNTLNIAVEGCCHGELDRIYWHIQEREEEEGLKVDLLLICGDFESIRNYSDLECVAVPQNYRKLNSFHEYVMGTKVAPILTVFIGGNHEASNVLQSLYYGGYVAPNIYFLGFAGVINFRGIRIGGLSGIYNFRHYRQGKHERPPYNADSLRSIYHLRELEVFRMTHLQKSSVDVFLSHDWPQHIWEHGDKANLLRMKPFFKQDMDSGELGSPPGMQLLKLLKPSYWFSGHMHVKFEATVNHNSSDNSYSSEDDILGSKRKLTDALGITESVRTPAKTTQFLALDKVLDKPGREGKYLEILQVPCGPWDSSSENELLFDYEWLTILRKTHYLVQDTRNHVKMPVNPFKITEQDVEETRLLMRTAYEGSDVIPRIVPVCITPTVRGPPRLTGNHQTDRLLSALNLEHRWTCAVNGSSCSSGMGSAGAMSMAEADSVFRAAASIPTSTVVCDDNAIDIDC